MLDSGIDQNDQKIRKADLVGRIKEGKSWIKSPYNQDAYGHGTHVTRLLLETAPAADIYIAKICNDKLINNEFMQGIAEVC